MIRNYSYYFFFLIIIFLVSNLLPWTNPYPDYAVYKPLENFVFFLPVCVWMLILRPGVLSFWHLGRVMSRSPLWKEAETRSTSTRAGRWTVL